MKRISGLVLFALFAFNQLAIAQIKKIEKVDQMSDQLSKIKLKPGKKISLQDFKIPSAFPDRKSIAMYGKEWQFYGNSLKFDKEAFVSGKLAENIEFTIGGKYQVKISKDQIVTFHPNGNFNHAVIQGYVTAYNMKFNNHVAFYNDEFYQGTPADNYVFSGYKLKANSIITVHPATGKLIDGYNFEEITLTPTVKIPAGQCFYLDENLKIYRVFLVADAFVGPYKFKPTSNVDFYPGGQLKFGTLALEANIKGKLYKAGTRVTFDEAGNVTKAE